MANDAPARRIEHRAVDRAKTVRCPHCGRDVDTPRMEPWLIHGTGQYALRLVAFECPHCEHEIRLDD